MIATHLAPVGLHDLLIRHLRRGAEQAVGLGDALVAAGCGPSARAAGPTGVAAAAHGCPVTKTQQVLEARKVHGRQPEQHGHALQPRTRHRRQAIARERGLQLNLDEELRQIRIAPDRCAQARQRRIEVEAGLLALGEIADRGLDLLGLQMQRMHYRACRSNLLLGDATIGLGDMAHDPKRGRKEQLVHQPGIRPATEHRRADLAGIEQMADDHADQGADRTQRQQAERAADDFAAPVHVRCRCCCVLMDAFNPTGWPAAGLLPGR